LVPSSRDGGRNSVTTLKTQIKEKGKYSREGRMTWIKWPDSNSIPTDVFGNVYLWL
jgi:hypothetical protein